MLLGKGIVSFISENSIEKLIIIIFEKISFFLVLQIVLKIHKKNKWELYFLEWMWILFVYIISFIIYCCIFRVTLITNGSLLRDILICCIIVGLIAINGVVYYFVTNISKRNIEILRYSIMSLRLEQQESGLEEIKREYFEVRKIRHDMSNILLTGIELIRQHKYQEAEQYFDEFVENKLKEVPPIIVTESEIITALLNVKIARCKEENIRIRYQVLGDLKRVEEIDLGILLGNLLDNSIEASKKIDCKEKREICLSIENYKGYLRVIVKNTIAESILTRNPLLCSTKSDKVKHGFGIFSIKEIVNKNNGCLDIYEEGGYFVALILL